MMYLPHEVAPISGIYSPFRLHHARIYYPLGLISGISYSSWTLLCRSSSNRCRLQYLEYQPPAGLHHGKAVPAPTSGNNIWDIILPLNFNVEGILQLNSTMKKL
jgi:hypothetical protein